MEGNHKSLDSFFIKTYLEKHNLNIFYNFLVFLKKLIKK